MDTERVALKSITFKIEPELFAKINEAMVQEQEQELSRFIIEAICDKLDAINIPYPVYVRFKRSRAGIGGPKPMLANPKPATMEKPEKVSSSSTSSTEAVVGRILALKSKPLSGHEHLPATDEPSVQKFEPIEGVRKSTNRSKTLPNQVPNAPGKKAS